MLDFEVGVDLLNVSQVFRGRRFRSNDPVSDFVEIQGSSRRTVIRIDIDGVGESRELRSLAILKGVDVNTFTLDGLSDAS
ncbi:MAG: hypothetical protein F6K30_13495 [Cyanothece sp. SIO2G6]|nr:hypothetical protein [Cyanothece sp. SIO2G6]